MPFLTFNPGPTQSQFNEDKVRSMKVGRRQLGTEWKTIHPPENPTGNWRLILPFANTYQNAFDSMCHVNAYAHLAVSGKLCLFLNGTEGDTAPPPEVTEWVERIGKPVAMNDFLALSFALDYERQGGNPQNPQTEIGELRANAKPYGGPRQRIRRRRLPTSSSGDV
jgi:hypothetical protein